MTSIYLSLCFRCLDLRYSSLYWYLLNTLAIISFVRKKKPMSIKIMNRKELKKFVFMDGKKMSGQFAVISIVVMFKYAS